MKSYNIDFAKIRSNIFVRDENVYINEDWENQNKAVCMVSPHSLNFKTEVAKENYIKLLKHLINTFRIFYKIRIITNKNHVELTAKDLELEKEEVYSLNSGRVLHGNLNKRQLLYSQSGNRRTIFNCSKATNFIDDGKKQLNSDLPELDTGNDFVDLPRGISFDEFCICDGFILISKWLEQKHEGIKQELANFFRIYDVIEFSAPDNETDLSRYFRSLDSVPPMNYGREDVIIADNPQLIYSYFNDKEVDDSIQETLLEIENTIKEHDLALDKMFFNNYLNKKAPNALDFPILDGVFLCPLYSEVYHQNYEYLSNFYPQNFFFSVTDPNLDALHNAGVSFSNFASLAKII